MILVTGATGFVGSRIMGLCDAVIPCPSLRGLSEEEIRRILDESGADTVIHTAAISDTGVCQRDPEAAWQANVALPVALARAAGDRKLIFFSSDQVYAGTESEGPYTEADARPANVYGQCKLEMERRVLDLVPDAVMLRAEWMYDHSLKRPNYFMNVLTEQNALSFSSRQYRGITYVKEVARQMEQVTKLPGGVYNFGSETDRSMYEITRQLLALLGRKIPLLDGPPRHNLWMNCQKAAKYGVCFRNVEAGLRACAEDHGLIPGPAGDGPGAARGRL